MKMHANSLAIIMAFVIGLIEINLTMLARTAEASPVQASNLVGSELKTEDVLPKSKLIFVGQVTDAGVPSVEDAGLLTYRHVKIEVSRILRGTTASIIFATLRTVATFKYKESSVEIEKQYIFFAEPTQGQSDPFLILKVLPASNDNLIQIQKESKNGPPFE
jgi:hypothetical protein